MRPVHLGEDIAIVAPFGRFCRLFVLVFPEVVGQLVGTAQAIVIEGTLHLLDGSLLPRQILVLRGERKIIDFAVAFLATQRGKPQGAVHHLLFVFRIEPGAQFGIVIFAGRFARLGWGGLRKGRRSDREQCDRCCGEQQSILETHDNPSKVPVFGGDIATWQRDRGKGQSTKGNRKGTGGQRRMS